MAGLLNTVLNATAEVWNILTSVTSTANVSPSPLPRFNQATLNAIDATSAFIVKVLYLWFIFLRNIYGYLLSTMTYLAYVIVCLVVVAAVGTTMMHAFMWVLWATGYEAFLKRKREELVAMEGGNPAGLGEFIVTYWEDMEDVAEGAEGEVVDEEESEEEEEEEKEKVEKEAVEAEGVAEGGI